MEFERDTNYGRTIKEEEKNESKTENGINEANALLGELAQQIIRVRFEAHNNEWLQYMSSEKARDVKERRHRANKESKEKGERGDKGKGKSSGNNNLVKERKFHFAEEEDEDEDDGFFERNNDNLYSPARQSTNFSKDFKDLNIKSNDHEPGETRKMMMNSSERWLKR